MGRDHALGRAEQEQPCGHASSWGRGVGGHRDPASTPGTEPVTCLGNTGSRATGAGARSQRPWYPRGRGCGSHRPRPARLATGAASRGITSTLVAGLWTWPVAAFLASSPQHPRLTMTCCAFHRSDRARWLRGGRGSRGRLVPGPQRPSSRGLELRQTSCALGEAAATETSGPSLSIWKLNKKT